LNEDNKAFVVFYMSTRRKIAVEPFEKVREGLLNNMRQERVQAAVGALTSPPADNGAAPGVARRAARRR